jgi:hypothetical protein
MNSEIIYTLIAIAVGLGATLVMDLWSIFLNRAFNIPSILGIVTVAVPFFVMQPSFGLGIASSKTPNPTQAMLRSLMNHAVFGLGLYLSALAFGFAFRAYA